VQGTAPVLGLPYDEEPHSRPKVVEMQPAADALASRIGAGVGELRRRMELIRTEAPEAASRATREITGRASQASRRAAIRLERWSEQAAVRASELREEGYEAVQNAKQRARDLANRYPVQTVAAIAGIGFLLGLTLRLGRRRRG
jgi:ElaB/YqjD/DUF883 family membrane-anchored ribosome-binding protein